MSGGAEAAIWRADGGGTWHPKSDPQWLARGDTINVIADLC